jgi:hypothetical protein
MMKKNHSRCKQVNQPDQKHMSLQRICLCAIGLFLACFQVSAQVEIHEFGAKNIQYYIYSNGKTFEFEAENTMLVDSIIVQSWLASYGGTFHIEISIRDSLLAKWSQYVNDVVYKPFLHFKQVSFPMSEGDTIVYKIYGGSFQTPVGGLNGVNYIRLTGAQHVITASVLPEGGGHVAGEGNYQNGTEVTLTASPASGFQFLNWTENGDIVMDGEVPAGDTYIFTATKNRHLTANFVINEYTLHYFAGDHGSITGECTQTVEHGSDGCEVEAMPEVGYHFLIWSDGKDTAARIDTNITEDLSFTAHFSINMYSISTAVNNNTWGNRIR